MSSSINDRTIEITVGPAGETTVQTKGFSGASCRDASQFLERALGDADGERLTAEFYHSVPVSQQVGRTGL